MKALDKDVKIILLHHSTGGRVWRGGVPEWFAKYNADNGTNYDITETYFPKKEPYGWQNYPYDYWNIWVNHAGDEPFKEEPTLEMLTKEYDVIIFKNCYPVSSIKEDTGEGDITSNVKTLANYKLQYEAVKAKMAEFPDTRFVVWTPAALVAARTDDETGARAREFAAWMKDQWSKDTENVFVWDIFGLETEGGLCLKAEYAAGETDSHPNEEFCAKAAPSLCETVVSAIKS